MRWLVVGSSAETETSIRSVIEGAGGKIDPACEPIPLGGDEVSIEVEADADFASRLRDNEAVTGVYPSSEMTLY